jgi:hypothetical protein
MAIRSAVLLALLAAGLAACGTTYDDPPPARVAPAPVISAPPVVAAAPAPASSSTPVALATLKSGAFRAGSGLLESIGLVTLPPASAAAGASAAPAPGPYRLTLRMDDGSIQTVIADTRAVLVGDRLQITSDGRLIRP